MDLKMEELELRVEELIKLETPQQNISSLIAEKTGYGKQFVNYIVEAISLHYNDPKLLEHMVNFVAEKCKKMDPSLDIYVSAIPARTLKQIINPICKELQEDSAFGLEEKENFERFEPAKEFPLLTRMAIIATYCASYNPQPTDKRFFFDGVEIQKRKFRVGGAKAMREKCHESGPRQFDHERGMYIFLYFCKTFSELLDKYKDLDLWNSFTTQVNNLVDAGLLRVVSARENLDTPMYISLCDLNFVQMVAKSISLTLDLQREYLYDFADD